MKNAYAIFDPHFPPLYAIHALYLRISPFKLQKGDLNPKELTNKSWSPLYPPPRISPHTKKIQLIICLRFNKPLQLKLGLRIHKF